MSMPDKEKYCVLCERDAVVRYDFMKDIWNYVCQSCGSFGITGNAKMDVVPKLEATERARVSACTRERIIKGLPKLLLCSDETEHASYPGAHGVFDVIRSVFPQRIQDRFDRALANLCVSTTAPGRAVQLDRHNDVIPFMMAETPDTAWFILDEMAALGYISKFDGSTPLVGVTVRATGIERVQELESVSMREKSSHVFIAMWFDASTYGMFHEGLAPAVRDCGFEPRRIDMKETNNKICDEIIAEIRRSRFVIADFTGQRGGVYYEAGFAQGLGIPVIWTCRKDKVKRLHFDTRQYSHILWETPEDLNRQLAARIRATIPGAK